MSFTPVVRTSHSIVKSLLEFAKDRKIDVRTLDFELLSFETLMKREIDLEYKVIKETKHLSKDDFLNSSTLFVQEYSINVLPLKRVAKEIQISLAANKLKTKAIVTILPGSLFRKDLTLEKVKEMIWLKKLRAGLYIDIFEPNLDAQITKLIKIVPPDKPLSKELKFTVALGIDPIPPVDGQIEKLYEEKNSQSNSIIDSVDKGELIVRYLKEKDGSNGRSCDGKYIQMREPRTKNLMPIIDETILTNENKDFIEYFANDDGYISHVGQKLTISKTLKLEGADFKYTANIDGGDSSKDVSVHIAHKKSHSEDAVGSGVTINVKDLNIDGSVGSNVNISAQELKIDAQTHKNSKIDVQNSANVKLHRGDMRANDAEIDILESGKITAHRSIHVKKMLGGEAIAPIVIVDELLSNATIIASEYIEIRSLNGTNNKLIINPDAIESHHKELEELQNKAKAKIAELKSISADLDERLQEHLKQTDRMKTFQQRVLKSQKAGQTPMKQDIIRIKEFKRNSIKLQTEKEYIKLQQHTMNESNAEIEKIQNKDLHAKIVSRSEYDGHSKVIFVNMKTKEEILIMPEGKIETISLVLNDEGERVIKQV